MPIYEYETVPSKKGEKVKHYEIRQSMSDEPLTHHPETGEKLKKVFTAFAVGGGSSSSASASSSGGGCCGGSCGCHHN
ncbi:FmdB family zinc ribbon protein [Puniceicoccus vermicola]|uniref:Zinc ribbon domain-containing protein n=1 Tax=Puniceicoccus vermicola TaxID=388746 RepID=A0A7X1B0R5_9BACT|nr:zinc ribbon domain-containing protein [Puniceicoccus vermicola]MBC2603464.1 zinc ribbon domain-containing protein [Puniceicoccus vermicola]